MKSNRIAEATLNKLEQIREEENYPDINELIDELLIIRNKIRLRSAQKFFREKLKESNSLSQRKSPTGLPVPPGQRR